MQGIHKFQSGYFAKNRELFNQLAQAGQRPETLFLTCADSRVVPNLITDAAPGELFTVRNVGNMVPREDLPGGTLAAIEYAVEALGILDIIICGHTQCGAMEAVLEPDSVSHLPLVARWIKQASEVRRVIDAEYSHLCADAKLTAAAGENVLVQIENLQSLPWVARRLSEGRLRVSGWVFDISSGEVFAYDPELDDFLPIGDPGEGRV